MKKIFFSVLALTFGAFAFIACNEKEDLVEEGQGKQETPKDTTSINPTDTVKADVLGLPDQQLYFTRTINGLGQAIDFTNLANAVNVVIENLGYEYNWEAGIEAAAEAYPDFYPTLEGRIEALKKILESDEIDFDFESMYFEADVEFVLDTVSQAVDSVWFDTAVVATPFLTNINLRADHFRINFTTVDKHVFSLFLKGDNTNSSTITVTDSKTSETKSIKVPGFVQVALSLDGNNLLAAKGELSTDFEVKITGSVEKDEESDGNDSVFTVSELYAYGENLNLRGELLIDRYAVSGNVVYGKDKGFNLGAAASIAGQEVLSVNARLDATLSSMINFADTTYAGLLGWAMDYQSVRGLSVDAVLGGDQIKVFAALNENPVQYQEILNPIMLFAGGSQPDAESIAAMIAKFNEIFTGEIYFKGYNEPQAKFRLAYEAPSDSVVAEEISDGSTMAIILNSIVSSGLKMVIDTYDADGNAITVSFQEYFGGIDVKQTVSIVAANFQQAFGPLIEMFKEYEQLPDYEEEYLIGEIEGSSDF